MKFNIRTEILRNGVLAAIDLLGPEENSPGDFVPFLLSCSGYCLDLYAESLRGKRRLKVRLLTETEAGLNMKISPHIFAKTLELLTGEFLELEMYKSSCRIKTINGNFRSLRPHRAGPEKKFLKAGNKQVGSFKIGNKSLLSALNGTIPVIRNKTNGMVRIGKAAGKNVIISASTSGLRAEFTAGNMDNPEAFQLEIPKSSAEWLLKHLPDSEGETEVVFNDFSASFNSEGLVFTTVIGEKMKADENFEFGKVRSRFIADKDALIKILALSDLFLPNREKAVSLWGNDRFTEWMTGGLRSELSAASFTQAPSFPFPQTFFSLKDLAAAVNCLPERVVFTLYESRTLQANPDVQKAGFYHSIFLSNYKPS